MNTPDVYTDAEMVEKLSDRVSELCVELKQARAALRLAVTWADGLADPEQTYVAEVLLKEWVPVARAALAGGEA